MKLTAICALVASASAYQNMYGYTNEFIPKAAKHHSKQTPHHKAACEGYDKSGDLKDSVFVRKLYYTIWNSVVKGWYHSQRKNTVNVECMGDWMDQPMQNMNEVMDLLDQNKIFEITAPKVKAIADDFVDFFYKNASKCEVYRFTSDQFDWCSNNVGVCMYQEDFMNRMVQSATPLMSKTLDLANLMMSDETTCLNDTQNLELIDRIVTDIASIASSFIGFQGKWGQSTLGNETMDDMQATLDKAMAKYSKEHEKPTHHKDGQMTGVGLLGNKFENPFAFEFTPPNLGLF